MCHSPSVPHHPPPALPLTHKLFCPNHPPSHVSTLVLNPPFYSRTYTSVLLHYLPSYSPTYPSAPSSPYYPTYPSNPLLYRPSYSSTYLSAPSTLFLTHPLSCSIHPRTHPPMNSSTPFTLLFTPPTHLLFILGVVVNAFHSLIFIVVPCFVDTSEERVDLLLSLLVLPKT